MTALPSRCENIKKDRHSKHCHNQQNQFSLFVLSVDGMLGMEALVVISQLSPVMAEKMEEPILQVRGWVNGKIVIAVAMSYSQIIRRAGLSSLLQEQEPDWDPE